MSLEGFSKRGMELGSNPEQIKETSNDLRQQYLNAIKKLALQKMKNDLLFEGSLGAAMRSLSSLGIDVSKESMLKDIEYEVNRQRMNFDIEMPNISIEEPNINIENQSEIEQLKNNLGNIFQSIPEELNQPINRESSIPRELAIESDIGDEKPRNYNMSQLRDVQESNEQISTHTEQEKQEIRSEMKQAQEQLARTLEWAKQQPNEPTFTSTRSENISLSPEWTKDNGISGYTEPTIEQVRNGLESTNKEQNFGDVYEVELKKLTELKKSDNPNYEVELNNAIARISSLTDRIPNIREQIESDISYEMRNTNQNQQQEVVSTPTLDQEESERILQEQQKQMKDKIIDQIMSAMNKSGELTFGDISMSERMSTMQNIQNKLNAKNMDELQMLLSTYQEQNVEQETMRSGMHR